MKEDLARIAEQWTPLFALCDDEQAFAARAEDVSGWSVAQQLGHVALSMKLIADAIDNLVANPDENAGHQPEPIGMAVLQAGAIPRGAGQAPEGITPQDTPTQEDVRAQLSEVKQRWDAFTERADDLQAIPATFRHFALGNFTCAQWARFIAIHNDHHLAIVRDILDAANVPAPSE